MISCERDDICPDSTPTTPRLIISAYNESSPDNTKFIDNLLIFGVGNENSLSVTVEDIDINYDGTGNILDIYLPLKTDDDTTQYILHKDYLYDDNDTPDDTSDDIETSNADTITINYSREQVYVSRACGYKTIFNDVTFTIETDDDNWIKSRISVNNNQPVEDETETHYNIFH
ncbi:DUF6452 family protein [Flavivirga jejuensis]